jgi:hypothetical protein
MGLLYLYSYITGNISGHNCIENLKESHLIYKSLLARTIHICTLESIKTFWKVLHSVTELQSDSHLRNYRSSTGRNIFDAGF